MALLLSFIIVPCIIFTFFSYGVLSSLAIPCTPTSCPPTHFSIPTLKDNATQSVNLGAVWVDTFIDFQSIAELAIMNLNNDMSILPDNAKQSVLGSLYGGIFTQSAALISFGSTQETAVAEIAADATNIPIYATQAYSESFADKTRWPSLIRVGPTGTQMFKAMIALLRKYNYTNVLVLYTNDGYGGPSEIQFTSLAKQRGIPNVVSIAVATNPTANDTYDLVTNVASAVEQYQLRVIVVLTEPPSGWLAIDTLVTAGFYGNNFCHDMGLSYFSGDATGLNISPAMDGSILFSACDGVGQKYIDALAQWNAVNQTMFPGNRPSPNVLWIVYDAIYTFAHTLDFIMKWTGKTAEEANLTDYQTYTPLMPAFTGVGGSLQFNTNLDRTMSSGFNIYNVDSNGALSKSAYYDPTYKNFTFYNALEFYNASLVSPSPGYCAICINGTCNDQSECICNVGYTGEYCADRISSTHGLDIKKTSEYAVPGIVVVIAAFCIAIYYFRRRRAQLVLDIAKRQRSDIERYEIKLGEMIGRGASGSVYKAVFRGTDVAVKSVVATSVSKDVLEDLKLETAIMTTLRHPNIVLFMGSCFDIEKREMLLVMEFCSHGSLHDIIHNPKVQLPYELIIHMACQAAQGMSFLHQSNPPIIHCDMKSHNILLDDKWNARISDFGITRFKGTSKKAENKNQSNKTSSNNSSKNVGTIFWTAPEVLAGKPHTEASDCYSFGIVLWEMAHRKEPYVGKEAIAVAMEVMNKVSRPLMDESVPFEFQTLIRDCWDQEPSHRPNFPTIMSRLRNLSMQHPLQNFNSNYAVIEPPTGIVYLVTMKIEHLYTLFDKAPRATKLAVAMFNQFVRTNIELYNGYEVYLDKRGLLAAFSSCSSALDWCISTQVGLLRLSWPEDLLEVPLAAELEVGKVVAWRGIRARMGIHVGNPVSEVDGSNGRITYSGAVVEKAKSVLKTLYRPGSILVTSDFLTRLNSLTKKNHIEPFTTKMVISAAETKDQLFQVVPTSLSVRETRAAPGEKGRVPLLLPNSVPGAPEPTEALLSISSEDLIKPPVNPDSVHLSHKEEKPKWLISFKEITVGAPVAKGQVGDYSKGVWKSKEVAVKVLVNQKLKEEDYYSLISDAAVLRRVKHPNLLPFHGVCLKPSNTSLIVDFISRGSLRKVLSEELVPLPLLLRYKIAHQIASGMYFLSQHHDAQVRIHDNLKSNNILVTSDWEVKITDYAQTNIRDLARTMTSISSVAWTAPEVLDGEPLTESSSVYSFGIILWELYTRDIPYNNEHPLKVVAKILNGYRPVVPADCPQGLKTLYQNCCNPVPAQRPSWYVIVYELQHLITELEGLTIEVRQ